ncbi:hypothetical protein [Blastomonas aquatica]|uniref:Integron gene cassette protein n=1 Tax=Blastomonas aquatica TaxID=1510276 RepID=A0ABQ1JIU1_9SPHN|nr:hypothetical protein [Blastomonas aquatica]GGB70058.1 hypothetical protein GCM10010833_26660 [Blastomonas aquatica]
MSGFVMFFGVPAGLAMMVAVASGRILKKQPNLVPLTLRAMLAICSPVFAVLLFFYVWQRIDYAIHESSGGGDYMGPMTMLIYGAPIFGLIFLVSAFVAACVFART